eukprot:11277059-Alexandrium_andersonii.AAC.1
MEGSVTLWVPRPMKNGRLAPKTSPRCLGSDGAVAVIATTRPCNGSRRFDNARCCAFQCPTVPRSFWL